MTKHHFCCNLVTACTTLLAVRSVTVSWLETAAAAGCSAACLASRCGLLPRNTWYRRQSNSFRTFRPPCSANNDTNEHGAQCGPIVGSLQHTGIMSGRGCMNYYLPCISNAFSKTVINAALTARCRVSFRAVSNIPIKWLRSQLF